MTMDLFAWAEHQQPSCGAPKRARPLTEKDLWAETEGHRWRILKREHHLPNWRRSRWGPACRWLPPGTWTRIGGPNVVEMTIRRVERQRIGDARKRFVAWFIGELDRPG
jgi:hypothetical protein